MSQHANDKPEIRVLVTKKLEVSYGDFTVCREYNGALSVSYVGNNALAYQAICLGVCGDINSLIIALQTFQQAIKEHDLSK